MKGDSLRVRVLMSLQVSLLGMVSPNIRGVTCSWGSESIKVIFVFDGAINDEDRESAGEVETELMSHFPEYKVTVDCIRSDVPESLNKYFLNAWVYRRKES